jgi:hypothetical protein
LRNRKAGLRARGATDKKDLWQGSFEHGFPGTPLAYRVDAEEGPMRAKPVLMAALLAAALHSPLALADEVVEFQDGRYLKVESHEVLDASIRLNVSGDSYLIFPLSRVDRIERNGRDVLRQPNPVAVRADGSESSEMLVADTRGNDQNQSASTSSSARQTAPTTRRLRFDRS